MLLLPPHPCLPACLPAYLPACLPACHRFIPGPYNGPEMPDEGAHTLVDCSEIPRQVPVWRTPPPPPLLYSATDRSFHPLAWLATLLLALGMVMHLLR